MIRTGGGRFDPEDKYIYFLAGDGGANVRRRYYLTAVNDAMGPGDEESGITRPIRENGIVFLDSGIFNLTNRHMRETGCTMDQALALAPEEISGFDDLYDRYIELVRKYESDLWGYIELDQGGVENKRRTRARLEAEGLRPIPVYHPLIDGWDYFDELAQGYDRICFGNIVQAPAPVRIRLLHTMWERRRRYPHLWIHVLGLTVNEQSVAIPSDSCDSSSWSAGLRWSRADDGHMHLRGFGGTDVGNLPRDFRYARGKTVEEGEELERFKAARFYAITGEERTTIWQDIVQERDRLGFGTWPAVLDSEPGLRPGTHQEERP